MYQSNLFVSTTGYYKESGTRYSGEVIAFDTEKDSYFFISIRSGEVSNDHYPCYEFLVNKSNLNKVVAAQVFYTDFAGVEGFEYCNVAVLFEFLVLVGLMILLLLIMGIVWLIHKKNKMLWSGKKDFRLA